MYKDSFKTLHGLLKNDGVAVIAFPVFVLKDSTLYHLPIEQMLKKIGFTVKETFVYKRKKQVVGREIFILQP
jgi:tRNA G10  N-methylase Trm11